MRLWVRISTALGVLAWSISGCATPTAPTPVLVGGMADLDACSSTGRPRLEGLDRSGLAVRSAPSRTGEITQQLGPYHQFWLCDATLSGEWTGIVFDPVFDPDRHGDGPADCGVGHPVPSQRPYEGSCTSGWVLTSSIELLSG